MVAGARLASHRCVLLVPLAAGLVNFNQQVFDILDLTFHRLCLVPQLPVPPFQAVQLLLQRIQLGPFPLAIPARRRHTTEFNMSTHPVTE